MKKNENITEITLEESSIKDIFETIYTLGDKFKARGHLTLRVDTDTDDIQGGAIFIEFLRNELDEKFITGDCE